MAEEEIPEHGAVFTLGKTRFGEDPVNKFWLRNDPVKAVACGDDHSLVLTEAGKVYAFGSNNFGQLGLPSKTVAVKPTSVKSLKGRHVVAVACGRSHTLVALGEF